MAEENNQPVQAVPVPEIPRAAPAASDTSPKGSPLLVFLTVLLTLVGITDLILWGVVGYYVLRSL